MSIVKSLIVGESFSESFNGSDTGETVGSVVVKMGSTGNGHGPQGFITFVRPVERGVDHHRASLRDHCFNRVFGNAVLPFGADTAKLDCLVVIGKSPHEIVRLEDTVVGVVAADDGSMISSHAFKTDLGGNGLCGSEGNLVFNVNESTSGVTEDGAATELVDLVFTAGCVRKTSTCSGIQLIHEDELPGFELAKRESAFFGLIFGDMNGAGRSAGLLSALASGAFRHELVCMACQ